MELSHNKPKLFMVLLGCTPSGRLTEQHDIFFGIANFLKELIPEMQAFWPEANGKIHVEIDTSKNHMGGFDEERTSYYKTGNIKEKSTYINNHEQGECEFYYNNGRIKKRYNIINRKKDGPEETYYANGNRKLIVRYTNGKKEGVALFWDHNGQETQIDYHNDQRRK
jgi:antitoxin component YwqK of YwqJK toxin-antitoxin module